jgi:putative hydrolase of the HAD superfamily
MMIEALDVDPERCIYLDDLGINLKPARAMGMQTIKVSDPSASIDQLSSLLQIDLRAHP